MAASMTTTVRTAVRRESRLRENIRLVLSYALLFLIALAFLYPFVLAISTSFKTLPEINERPVALIPQTFTLEGYQRMFALNVGRWALNSFFIASVVTISNVLFSALAGYSLTRIAFPGSRYVFLAIIGTMMIPGIVQLIPMFIVLKTLGMIDSYTGLIIPKMVTAFGIFLMAQFFEAIPRELEEAARIDGAGRFRMFFQIALPLARPAIVALVIFSFQGSWNEFMHPLIVITTNQDLYTLPIGLAFLRGGLGQNLQWNALLAGSMLTTVPMAVIFFFFQRYFIEGISYTGVKG
ncbi:MULTISPECIES: carbohydrate ABC transporter permease [Caldilinea]|jgi:multiple sugar transport system permease protein|uniref:Putative ABC transporter permease protein n=1 Tax=Caldilinea aerophila (strain DSM 14535 / JCM 11387 / NBRC 104270 / STL-6-O1) TaxID=926550 RepID=I0I7A2_CALAS|nr:MULTISPECIES: carbohydrate ABC transporter permease [Caldilinea]MBO9393871.1 carbohydrate ABC transporter permease [Caldilinea sp.]BAM01140.1 putative ABC transporter permease protein [Caldilinea aerophila DSM 14535 = NBRC 104270]GIV72479.1 MAG: sn-glycerol-3-phosphate transport system permease protein UgpE [Caldilinea sp.]